MRLLNSLTLEFKEFFEENSAPHYAILSHTWEEDEVTFKDMLENRTVAEGKAGFKKIKWCAKQAVADGLDFIWVDTCCIDKSSSAELSEAINSMFRWYRRSAICYAYLSDVSGDPRAVEPDDTSMVGYSPFVEQSLVSSKDSPSLMRYEVPQSMDDPEIKNSNPGGLGERGLPPGFTEKFRGMFMKARWFGRGWTLQELIAPSLVVFFTSVWVRIGTKSMYWLLKLLEDCTGIPRRVLNDGNFSRYSIAQRMSWAASRVTTRAEDTAYCLMGLFEIHMPMLYGEGERAFIRLQEEIIKQSNDMSIFLWTDTHGKFSTYRGLLARAPFEFAQSRNVAWNRLEISPGPEISSQGIKLIDVHIKCLNAESNESFIIFPGCRDTRSRSRLGIYLQRVSQNQYSRVDPDRIYSCEEGSEPGYSPLSTTFVRQKPILTDMCVSRLSKIQVDVWGLKSGELSCVKPSDYWNAGRQIVFFVKTEEVTRLPLVHFLLLLGDVKVDLTLDPNRVLHSCLSTGEDDRLAIARKPNKHANERLLFDCTYSDKIIMRVALERELVDDEFVVYMVLESSTISPLANEN